MKTSVTILDDIKVKTYHKPTKDIIIICVLEDINVNTYQKPTKDIITVSILELRQAELLHLSCLFWFGFWQFGTACLAQPRFRQVDTLCLSVRPGPG